MNGIHFLRPYCFLLIIPVAILICFLIFRQRRHAGPWQNICSKDLLPYILVQKGKNYYFSYVLAALTLLLLITAMSGPAWQQISQPLIKQKTGLVIALDLSPVMDAQDIKPSRLQRAIYKINDLLKMHHEGQVALIVFSGDPFVVTPLTDDIATIKNLLPALETRIMPSSGHRVHLAISKAGDLLRQAGINHGSMLLITSELSNSEMEASITTAKQQGLNVSVLGVGTDETTPIPLAGGGLLKNSEGALVMSSLSKNNLNKLAQSTGGTFAIISVDDNDLRQLIPSFSAIKSSAAHEETELKQERWHDQGYLLVLLALPFASLIFRRGLLIITLFLMPHMAHAISFDDLWKTKDQQAQELFQQGDYAQANDLFQNQEWQAICSYKLGDFERAAQLFEGIPTAEGLFNYGTARAKLEDFEGALEAYDKALELKPDHEDALYNKNVIEEFLKQNQDQKQDNKKDQKDQKNQNRQKSDKEKNKSKSDKENSDKDSEDQKQNEQQDNDKEQPQDKQQDKQQGNEQDEDDGQEGDHEQDNNPQDRNSSDANKDTAEADEQSSDELRDQYRDNIEKEMQKEKDQLSENEASQDVQQELKTEEESDPQRHIDERWLKRIQDDPAGLLRRKFQQQYRQQQKAK